MTNEEAIIKLLPITDNMAYTDEFQDACKVAIEALKKQLPKKVTHEATLLRCCTCPSCKNVIDEFTDFRGMKVRVEVPHCKYCGQAIDWSNIDER